MRQRLDRHRLRRERSRHGFRRHRARLGRQRDGGELDGARRRELRPGATPARPRSARERGTPPPIGSRSGRRRRLRLAWRHLRGQPRGTTRIDFLHRYRFGGSSRESIYGPQDIAALYAGVAALRSDVIRGYEGTAIAIALGGGTLPDNKRYAI